MLKETEVRPIHRFINRVVTRLGMPLEADELAALDEHGARFWSRWFRNSWSASAFAYAGTWGEVILSRAIEQAIRERQEARDAKARGADRTPSTAEPVSDASPAPATKRNGAPTPEVDVQLDDAGAAVYGNGER